MAKLGRNDPCWCGSRLKYKKCHLNRENQDPVDYYSMVTKLRKNFSWKQCLHPDACKTNCSSSIVKAHTLRRAADLKTIAENGHVYNTLLDMIALKKLGRNPGPRLVGINSASTFYGFCSKHDHDTFVPLEKEEFANTPQQCFLLGFRALTKEIYAKQSAIKSLLDMRIADKGLPLSRQTVLQEMLDSMKAGHESAISDLKHHQQFYNQCLHSNNFEEIRCLVVLFDLPPFMLCSGMKQPTVDFQGNPLQDLGRLDLTLDMLSLSIISEKKHTLAVFAWHQSSDNSCIPFIKSLLEIEKRDVPAAIFNFTIDSFENLFLKPSWWDSLSTSQKNYFISRMNQGTPLGNHDRISIVDDRLDFSKYKILEMIKINIPT